MSFWTSDIVPVDQLSTRQKVAAFATMCVGMFVALLDIQIVSASLRDIAQASRKSHNDLRNLMNMS